MIGRVLVVVGVGALLWGVSSAFAQSTHGIAVAVNPELEGVKTVTVTDRSVAGPSRIYTVARLGGGVYTVTRINGTGNVPSFQTFSQSGPIGSAGPDLAQLESDMRLFPADLFKE